MYPRLMYSCALTSECKLYKDMCNKTAYRHVQDDGTPLTSNTDEIGYARKSHLEGSQERKNNILKDYIDQLIKCSYS